MTNNKFLNDVIAWVVSLGREAGRHTALLYGLFLAIGATLLFGFAESVVDPNIHSLWDGIWYAWVTLTHVGYGDIVPSTLAGRVLASLLIFIGLCLLALLTAAFSSILIGRDTQSPERDDTKILAEIARLHERLDRLESQNKPAPRPRRSTEH